MIKVLLRYSADPNIRVEETSWVRMNSPNDKIKYKSDSTEGPMAIHALAGLRSYSCTSKDKAHVEECLKLLIDAGADVNASMTGNHKPLHYAINSRNCSLWGGSDTGTAMIVTSLLLQYGADPNVRCHGGATPLHKVGSSRPEIIELLLKNGADVNVKNNNGSTPLLSIMSAYDDTKSEAIQQTILKLLEHGAGKFQPLRQFRFVICRVEDTQSLGSKARGD